MQDVNRNHHCFGWFKTRHGFDGGTNAMQCITNVGCFTMSRENANHIFTTFGGFLHVAGNVADLAGVEPVYGDLLGVHYTYLGNLVLFPGVGGGDSIA